MASFLNYFMSNEQLAQRPETVKDYLSLPDYKLRFQEVLGARAPQFMSALLSIAAQPHLARCEPRSVIGAAMVAATLDLPIEKSLGFAHVVPYGNVAQFQMAAKGYVQLALRSAQYQRMNAKPINVEAFGGYDEVGEPKILWEHLDETKPVIGYAVAWKLTNGFTKIAYWPRAKVEAHAQRFSKAYAAKRQDSPWFSNFDKMALKTIVMNELRAWGVLSVQMQTALKHDMAAMKDVSAEPEFVDSTIEDADQIPGDPAPARPAPPARAKKGAAAVASTPTAPEVVGELVTEPEKPAPVAEPALATTQPPEGKVFTESSTAATKDVAPRAFLNDKEEITATCTVVEVGAIDITKEGAIHPSVQAILKGDFVGTVFHIGGGVKEGDKTIPGPLWAVGASLKLKLAGKLNTKAGKVMTFVSSVEAASGTVETMEA